MATGYWRLRANANQSVCASCSLLADTSGTIIVQYQMEDPFEDFEQILGQQSVIRRRAGDGGPSSIGRPRPQTASSLKASKTRQTATVGGSESNQRRSTNKPSQTAYIAAANEKLETLSEVSEELSVDWREEEEAGDVGARPADEHSIRSGSSSEGEQVRAMVNLVSDLDESSSSSSASLSSAAVNEGGTDFRLREEARNSSTLSGSAPARRASLSSAIGRRSRREGQVVEAVDEGPVKAIDRHADDDGDDEPGTPFKSAQSFHGAAGEAPHVEEAGRIQGNTGGPNLSAHPDGGIIGETLRQGFDLLGDNLIVKLERRFSSLMDSILADASLAGPTRPSSTGLDGPRSNRTSSRLVELDSAKQLVRSGDEAEFERRHLEGGSDSGDDDEANDKDCCFKSTNSMSKSDKVQEPVRRRAIYDGEECLRAKISQSDRFEPELEADADAYVDTDAPNNVDPPRGAENRRERATMSDEQPLPIVNENLSFEALANYYKHRLAKLNRIILINSMGPNRLLLADDCDPCGRPAANQRRPDEGSSNRIGLFAAPAKQELGSFGSTEPDIAGRSYWSRSELFRWRARSLQTAIRLASSRIRNYESLHLREPPPTSLSGLATKQVVVDGCFCEPA